MEITIDCINSLIEQLSIPTQAKSAYDWVVARISDPGDPNSNVNQQHVDGLRKIADLMEEFEVKQLGKTPEVLDDEGWICSLEVRRKADALEQYIE